MINNRDRWVLLGNQVKANKKKFKVLFIDQILIDGKELLLQNFPKKTLFTFEFYHEVFLIVIQSALDEYHAKVYKELKRIHCYHDRL
jgi:hypothetical protein